MEESFDGWVKSKSGDLLIAPSNITKIFLYRPRVDGIEGNLCLDFEIKNPGVIVPIAEFSGLDEAIRFLGNIFVKPQ